MEEVFAKLDTGKWECKSCGYTYDVTKGDASYPVSPGTMIPSNPLSIFTTVAACKRARGARFTVQAYVLKRKH